MHIIDIEEVYEGPPITMSRFKHNNVSLASSKGLPYSREEIYELVVDSVSPDERRKYLDIYMREMDDTIKNQLQVIYKLNTRIRRLEGR